MRGILFPFTKIFPFSACILLCVLALSLSGCKDEEGTNPGEEMNLLQVAESRTELSYYLAVVDRAGLMNTLTDEHKELTIFAPNNEAFEAYITQTGIQLDDIPQEDLRKIIEDHAVQGSLMADDLNSGTINSISGEPISVSANQVITLNSSARIVVPDLVALNGVIHIIDDML